MICTRTLLPVLLLMSATACLERPLDDVDGDAEEQADGNEDPDAADEGDTEDPWNCGELGLNCVGPFNVGECIDGECQAKFTGCFPAVGTCEEMCGEQGATCHDRGCDDSTAFLWDGDDVDEALESCALLTKPYALKPDIGCDDPLDEHGLVANCCCRW